MSYVPYAILSFIWEICFHHSFSHISKTAFPPKCKDFFAHCLDIFHSFRIFKRKELDGKPQRDCNEREQDSSFHSRWPYTIASSWTQASPDPQALDAGSAPVMYTRLSTGTSAAAFCSGWQCRPMPAGHLLNMQFSRGKVHQGNNTGGLTRSLSRALEHSAFLLSVSHLCVLLISLEQTEAEEERTFVGPDENLPVIPFSRCAST